MKGKLKLRLDDLRVDGFETAAGPLAKGTVFGEENAAPVAFGTEIDSCPASCRISCNHMSTCLC